VQTLVTARSSPTEFTKCESIADLGYRLYYTRREQHVYMLLVGGDKGSQKRDIRQAIEMARNL
jgi:putative addiction module killer protein